MGPLSALHLEQMSDEILLMQSLHHHNGHALALVVVPGRQSALNQPMARSRSAFDFACSGFIGSSMMMMLPPRPVSVPSTEVPKRHPPWLVMNSVSVSL